MSGHSARDTGIVHTLEGEVQLQVNGAAPLVGAASAISSHGRATLGSAREGSRYKDLYDSEFDAMAGYSVTDDVKYDAGFPKHALSRIRATFPDILSSIQIANSEDATSAD